MRLLLAATVLLLAAPASGYSPEEDGKRDTSKKICKVDPEDTDSRIRRRICKTEAEWSGKSDDAKAEADHSSKRPQ